MKIQKLIYIKQQQIKKTTLKTEDIEAIEKPMDLYNVIIAPVLSDIKNINIKDNPIFNIFEMFIEKQITGMSAAVKRNFKKYLEKIPKEQQKKLNEILSNDIVKQKFNEVGKSYIGIDLGDLLISSLTTNFFLN